MRRPGSLSLIIAVVVLIAVPLFELWLLIQVGQWIGVLPTVAIVIAEALLGGWLMKREGRTAWRALNASLSEGRAPTRELTDAALVLVGGVLLIFPGFLTDLLGFICLIPFTRPLARWVLGFAVARRLAGMAGRGGFSQVAPGLRTAAYRGNPDDLIEGEVVDPSSGGSRPDADPTVIRGELDHH